MEQAVLPVIGVLRTPFASLADIPRQAFLARDLPGRAELRPEYAEGLRDLKAGDRIFLYFLFHESGQVEMVTRSRGSGRLLGVFATRSPRRPSRLGVSRVEVERVEGATVFFRGVDMLDGSPLLDIKPDMDEEAEARAGEGSPAA